MSEQPRPSADRFQSLRERYRHCSLPTILSINSSPVYGQFDIRPLLLVLAASVYFLANTGLYRHVISLTEGRSFKKIWADYYCWSFPYYLGGAAIAGMIGWLNRSFQWQSSLLAIPVVYLIYRSYSLVPRQTG